MNFDGKKGVASFVLHHYMVCLLTLFFFKFFLLVVQTGTNLIYVNETFFKKNLNMRYEKKARFKKSVKNGTFNELLKGTFFIETGFYNETEFET